MAYGIFISQLPQYRCCTWCMCFTCGWKYFYPLSHSCLLSKDWATNGFICHFMKWRQACTIMFLHAQPHWSLVTMKEQERANDCCLSGFGSCEVHFTCSELWVYLVNVIWANVQVWRPRVGVVISMRAKIWWPRGIISICLRYPALSNTHLTQESLPCFTTLSL